MPKRPETVPPKAPYWGCECIDNWQLKIKSSLFSHNAYGTFLKKHILFFTRPKPSKDKIDFDELLNYIGGWGKFQITLLNTMIQFTFFLAYVGYSPILYLYTPDHWCSIPEEVQNKVNFTNMVDLLDVLIPYDPKIQKRSQCLMYDISGIDDPSALLLNNSAFVPITSCTNGYTYNFTGYFHSASTEVSY